MKRILFLSLFFVVYLNVNAQRTNRLDSTGNAGIGILSPTEKLEIYSYGLSNIKLTNYGDVLGTVGALKFNLAGTDVGMLEMERTIPSGRASDMKFFVKGSGSLYEAMRIVNSGAIGVGLTNPDEMFHIRKDKAGSLYMKVQNNQEDMTATAGVALTTLNGIWKLNARRKSGFSISSPTVTDVMVVTNEGNLGIGETAPTAKLQVTGDVGTVFGSFAQDGIPVSDAGLTIKNGTAAPGVYIPSLTGRTYMPGRSYGFYCVGEAEDVLPASDASVGAIVLDGRTKTSTKLATNNVLAVNSFGVNLMLVKADGSVGIGTTDTKGYKLAVNGSGVFTKVVVKAYSNWPDYVFHKDYQLPSLQQVEQYVSEHQHLPGIPSAGEVEADGVDLGDMNKKLLQKIEEQMLYIIEMNKKLESLTNEVKDLKAAKVVIK